MTNLNATERDLLAQVDDDEGSAEDALDEQRKADLDRRYPKPTEQDIANVRSELEAEFREWKFGEYGPTDEDRETAPTFTDGIPGLARIRQMRYHRDRMPQKWQNLLQTPYRIRSHFTGQELERTVALATRNPPQVKIKPASSEPDAREAAEREQRWCQALIPALERAVNQPLLRMYADALFEGGDAAFVPYVTGAYDDVDFDDQKENEDDDAYNERKDAELQAVSASGALPIGVRVPDMMGVLYDEDETGIYVKMLIEHKPHRVVYSELMTRLSPEKVEELRMPRPGDRSVGTDSSWWGGSLAGISECITYCDRRWYVYEVNGRIVECAEHEMPGVPFITGHGFTTSSARRAERYQGVVWGTIEQEQAINDWITTEVDIGLTFGRPKPYVKTPVGGNLRNPTSGPQVVKFDGSGAVELMPGQEIADAAKDFESRLRPEVLNILLSIRQNASINPVSAGESPGADPSGFALNSMQAASQMRFETLLDNYARSIGLLLDYIRKMVKYGPIGEPIFLTVTGRKGAVEVLGLRPDEISDVPCEVSIDPMNDVNRLAIRESLMVGQERGFVPRRIVQTLGFGASDADEWDDEIAEDMGEVQLMGLALEAAKQIVFEQPAGDPAAGSGLVGPNGQPIQSGG
ncbi:MAG: hypothetical protein NUW01_03700, partial [Gemmatimonadaceae bacterium]|nr:hypothetical protein [Gemmatimonadaceae bacterium]